MNVIGYADIAAIAMTSFDAPRKWLGPQALSVLQTYGSDFLRLDFAKSFLPRAFVMPEYWTFVVGLITGLAVLGSPLSANHARRKAPGDGENTEGLAQLRHEA